MTDQTYRLTSARIAAKCAEHILNDIPHDGSHQIEVKRSVRTRTAGQNSRYWATMTEELRNLAAGIAEISSHTGYSSLEVCRIVAKELPSELVAILYARTPEAVHEILKTINGIPTSTRLGTKEFMQHEERMLQTIAEVVGAVRAVVRAAA